VEKVKFLEGKKKKGLESDKSDMLSVVFSSAS
jgi:hypothetical protein